MNNSIHRGSSRGATPRLLLLGLVCVASLAAGVNWAAATDWVPFKADYELQNVSSINNPDGSRDQVYTGQGTASHAGTITVVIQVHIQPTEFDAEFDFFYIEFSGTVVLTAANGDTILSTLTGVEFLPAAPDGNPEPPPYHIEGAEQITGGSGRFAGATGWLGLSALDHGDGTIAVSSEGVISSAGSARH